MIVVCVLCDTLKTVSFQFCLIARLTDRLKQFIYREFTCALWTRLCTICQIESQSTAQLRVRAAICVLQCSKYKIQFNLSSSSIID